MLSDVLHKGLSGTESKIWQHENDHFNGIYIY